MTDDENQSKELGRRFARLKSVLKRAGAVIVEKDSITHMYSQPLERLSKADPSKVQEIAASQIELLSIYHKLVLEQARRSFRWAIIAAGIGFCFFLASVAFLLFQQPQNLAVISLISGALVQIISAINFYLYGRTSAQLADFQIRLDQTQRFLLANSVCEGLDGEYKQQSRAELSARFLGYSPQAQRIRTRKARSPAWRVPNVVFGLGLCDACPYPATFPIPNNVAGQASHKPPGRKPRGCINAV